MVLCDRDDVPSGEFERPCVKDKSVGTGPAKPDDVGTQYWIEPRAITIGEDQLGADGARLR